MNHKNQLKSSSGVTMHKLIPGIILAAAFVLSACGGGADNTQNTVNGSGQSGGTGGILPTSTTPAQNEDTQNFRLNFWDNVRAGNRCGSCHDDGGTANSDFANNDDVNSSYNIAIGLVNVNDIANSTFVRKFRQGTGHFCWENTQNACAVQLELWINNWLTGTSGAGGRAITLTPPADSDPSAAISFADDAPGTYAAVHTLLTTHCVGCHVPNATLGLPQQPYFAVSIMEDSYDTMRAVPLINLSTPALSRFYTRLNNDGHRCWDAGNGISCADSAAVMLAAINTFIGAAAPDTTELDSMVKSRAVQLIENGIIASGGSRYEANQIALFEFKTGSGNAIIDTSGVSPAMNLRLYGVEGTDYEWLGSYGIQFNTAAAKAQADTVDSVKLQQMISSTGEYTIETWILPSNVSQENANIAEYSVRESNRNFMLDQDMYAYRMYNRGDDPAATNADATPLLATADEDAQSALQHVVVTYDPANGRRIYVNGTFRDDDDPVPGNSLSTWNADAELILANSSLNSRPWAGTMRLFAVHNRVLTDDQIRQNFDVGVGQKFFLMFDVSEHISQCQGADIDGVENDPIRNPDYAPLCFVYLEAAQFDNSSFLFAYPQFVTLDDQINVTGVKIKNMRIGINGREAPGGQGFANIDVTIGQPTPFDPAVGQTLSNIGTIVAFENGPGGGPANADKLFLTFEEIGMPAALAEPTKDYSESFPATPDPVIAGTRPAVTIRSFEQINATMAAMTMVDRTTAQINAVNSGTYSKVKQALPTTADISTYATATQMAITQLSIQYCNALVDGNGDPNGNTPPRIAFFPGLTFNDVTTPDLSFATQTERDLIIDPLLARVFNVDGTTELTTMPSAANVVTHLNTLMTDLNTSCGATCGFIRTQQIIKSTCAAALASSAMLLQ